MITRLHLGEKCRVRPGDVIFDITNLFAIPYNITGTDVDHPHAGLVCEEVAECDGSTPLLVVGLPGDQGKLLGTSKWDRTAADSWSPDVVGFRVDVGDEKVAEVLLVWNDIRKEVSRVGGGLQISKQVVWTDPKSDERGYKHIEPCIGSSGNFVSGTCAGFVEFCYERADLDLVDESGLNLSTLPTTFQMHAFYRDIYPLKPDLNDRRLLSYPQCCQ
jgi:hypothetical protein